jgi:predicted DNA-binding antitoxin AbrB/MazE fold protein
MEPIEAVYHDGAFHPIEPVVLPENCPVQVIPQLENGELKQDLDAIYAAMDLRFNSGEHDVAARHNEHQP